VATAQSLSGESWAGTVVLLGRAVLAAPAVVAVAGAFLVAQAVVTAFIRADLLVASSATPAELAAAGATQALSVTTAIDGIALANVTSGTTPCLRAKALGRFADSAS